MHYLKRKKISIVVIKYIAFIEFSLKIFTFPSRGTCLGWKPNLNSMKWEFDELRIRWNENSMSCEFDELRIRWVANSMNCEFDELRIRWTENSMNCESMKWEFDEMRFDEVRPHRNFNLTHFQIEIQQKFNEYTCTHTH